jgi:membrane protease YdiL (CAAX protease family)
MNQKFLGVLSWVGMALVFAAVAVRVLGAVGAIQVTQQIDQYAVYAAWAGLALVVIYTLGQWRDIATYFKRRNARYGAVAGVSVLVALGILVAVNYLSARQNKRWDLTANKQFSLSEQTIKLLKSLDAPAKFLVFDQDANFDRFRSRLTEYQYQSKNVQVEYIDAD